MTVQVVSRLIFNQLKINKLPNFENNQTILVLRNSVTKTSYAGTLTLVKKMEKHINTHSVNFLMLISISCLLGFGCINRANQVEDAKRMSELLLDRIGEGTAIEDFPEKYFPREQGESLLYDLKENCDFKNREGVFVNDFTSTHNTQWRASFIYEFMLKCDTIRFVITYNLGKEPELFEFHLEPIEKPNPMILKPENRLKLD